MGCIFLILHILNDFGFYPEHIDYYVVEISWFLLYSPQEGWGFCFSGHIVTVRWHLRFACGGWQLGSLQCQHLILTWAASSLPHACIDQGGSQTLWRSSHTELGAPLPPISAFLDFSPHCLALQPTLCSWSSGHRGGGFPLRASVASRASRTTVHVRAKPHRWGLAPCWSFPRFDSSPKRAACDRSPESSV